MSRYRLHLIGNSDTMLAMRHSQAANLVEAIAEAERLKRDPGTQVVMVDLYRLYGPDDWGVWLGAVTDRGFLPRGLVLE